MILIQRLLAQRKLVLTLSILLALMGLFFWFNMARQEDPRMPDLWGQVVTPFPGTDAETVERLVLEPLEEHLASVDEIKKLESTAFAEVAVIKIDLLDNIKDTDKAWDEVREALAEARRDFPEGVGEPSLNDALQDNESIVYALSGHPDPLVLASTAEDLKDKLLTLRQVSQVKIIADPGEQVVIEIDDSAVRRLGLDSRMLVAQLQQRNQILPGGSVELAGRSVTLRPLSEFESLEEIRKTPVLLPSGDMVPLESVARVRQGPEEPVTSLMRFDGRASVGLGIVPRKGGNVLHFGGAVRDLMTAEAENLDGIEVEEVIFQPDRVRERLSDLGRSLILGVMIVAGVLMLAMGLRLGLIVASVVPLVVLSSLAIYAITGGTLHQISIAALVIALGMLVDNAIVMAEGIQWRIDHGEGRAQATVETVRELALPLAAATGTTLAAFVPMLLAEGGTGEFTRAIPIVIMLTLTVSYLFAIFVTPALSALFLRRHMDLDGRAGILPQSLGEKLGRLTVRRPVPILVAALLAVGLSLAFSGRLQQSFFPASDRNQLVVDLQLPEGSHLAATDAQARRLEEALLEHAQVVSVAAFVGRSTPKFYYNLNFIPWSPHLAQLVVETTSTETLDEVMAWIRDMVTRTMPGAELVVRKLEQGPSIEAPVEIRLVGGDLETLSRAGDVVLAELREIPGTEDVRSSRGTGAPTMRFRVDDAAAARRGLSRSDVALALYGRTRGLPVGEFRSGDDPIPIVLRSSAGEAFPAEALTQIDVTSPGGDPVPLSQLAQVELDWRPAAIHHFQGRRVLRVLSELSPGASYSTIQAQLEPRLAGKDLGQGVRWEFGGADEGSGEANVAIMKVMPVGTLLLLTILMAEFRSFRRVAIVLVTVPLAAAGVVPGLLLANQPFGFMSMLGVFALIGVVVNNAIVLLEVVEARRKEGADLDTAIQDAVRRRLRPIVLTTATTVAGLLPLAFSPSTLWPPMAWAMISGLIGSTFLTVLVVPALYRLLFRKEDRAPKGTEEVVEDRQSGTSGALATATLGIALLVGVVAGFPALGAPTVTLAEAMEEGAQRPQAQAAFQRAVAAEQGAVAERRAALLPIVTAGAAISDRSEDFAVVTPVGDLQFGDSRSEDVQLSVVQPLLDPSRRFYGTPAARAEARAARGAALRSAQASAAGAAEAFLGVLEVDARLRATQSFIESLEGRYRETEARAEAGRSLRSDALKVRLALDAARQDRLALEQGRQVATTALGMAMGRDEAVEPDAATIADDQALSVLVPPAREAAVALAFEHRADLASLKESSGAAGLRHKAVRAERLPRLEASARWIYSSGSPYRQDSWVEGQLGVAWNPFAAGTRGPRGRALREEMSARENELLEARRGVELEVRAALAALITARGSLAVGVSGVDQATEALRVERERYEAGRSTTNDLLDAEAALRSEATRREVARVEVLRAWIRLELALGAKTGSALLPASLR